MTEHDKVEGITLGFLTEQLQQNNLLLKEAEAHLADQAEERDMYKAVLWHLVDVIMTNVDDPTQLPWAIPAINQALRVLHHYNCHDCAEHEELPF